MVCLLDGLTVSCSDFLKKNGVDSWLWLLLKCRCRNGVFHVVNNFYEGWGMYAIGGSANPVINSEGNRFIAPNSGNMKEVRLLSLFTLSPKFFVHEIQ